MAVEDISEIYGGVLSWERITEKVTFSSGDMLVDLSYAFRQVEWKATTIERKMEIAAANHMPTVRFICQYVH